MPYALACLMPSRQREQRRDHHHDTRDEDEGTYNDHAIHAGKRRMTLSEDVELGQDVFKCEHAYEAPNSTQPRTAKVRIEAAISTST